MDTKRCANCRADKPLGAYWKREASPDGRENACAACRKARRPSRAATEAPTAPPPESRVLAPAPPPIARADGLERILIVPDVHHPNHDEAAWGLMLRAAHIFKPDTVVVLGDFADAESLSAHPATEPGANDFQRELDTVKLGLDQLDQLGAARKVYCQGNHETRLERYLMRAAPALFRMVRWQNLLELHRRGWEWVPYGKAVKIGHLSVTHDTGSAGMNAHRQAAVDVGGSAVIGHTHRLAYEVRGRFNGTPYVAAMFGWLGDQGKAASYIHEARAAASWAHGFGVGYMETSSGVVHLQPVPIVHGRCVVGGQLIA